MTGHTKSVIIDTLKSILIVFILAIAGGIISSILFFVGHIFFIILLILATIAGVVWLVRQFKSIRH